MTKDSGTEYPYGKLILQIDDIKGTVQQKLTWVKSGINRQLMVSSCSDGHFLKI
jgi:hypothetical protein